MDDYTIKEKDKEVAGITVTYDEGYLRKSGDERYRNDPNLYLPKNYYFLTDDYGVCKTCLFRVSHIQNYKILA